MKEKIKKFFGKKDDEIDEAISFINQLNNHFADFEFSLNELKGVGEERNPNRKVVNKVISGYQDIFVNLVKKDFDNLIESIFARFKISIKDKVVWGKEIPKTKTSKETKFENDYQEFTFAELEKLKESIKILIKNSLITINEPKVTEKDEKSSPPQVIETETE